MSGMLAKVINSSVGTSSFKSLDEVLLSKIRLVGSDDVFFSYEGDWSNVNDAYTKETTSYIVFDTDGTVNFKTFFNTYSNTGDKATVVKLMVLNSSGSTIASVEKGVVTKADEENASHYELSVPVNVTKGAKYKVRTSSSSSSSYLKAPMSAAVCATPVFTTGKCTLST